MPAADAMLPAGRRLGRLQLALLAAAGVTAVRLRAPRVRLARARPGDPVIDAAVDCIADAIRSAGGVVGFGEPGQGVEHALSDREVDAVVVIGGTGSGRSDATVRTLASIGAVIVHGVGLLPGETSAFGKVGARPVLALPGRLDAAAAAWHMLGRTLLARLADSREPPSWRTAKLTHKVTSSVGLAELVPVRLEGETARPLPIASGYVPLSSLALGRWLGSGESRERRLPGGDRGRDKTLAMTSCFMTARFEAGSAEQDLIAAIRRAARQEQFLEVVSAEEARARFAQHIDLSPLAAETVALSQAHGRVLAHDVIAPIDVPPFDRANVDGFALRSADTVAAGAGEVPRLVLNGEVIVCGHPPALEVAAGSATTIATGGVVPRGADAVIMVEHTELVDDGASPAIDVRRAVAPGQFVSYAGSDIARGEVVLRRRSAISSREIGMLAACGIAAVEVIRRPKVAVLSTGDELAAPGGVLGPARVYDSNGAIIAAAVTEAGGEPVALGAFPDNEAALERAVRGALAACDLVVLSGGTSKGAGDLSHRIISKLGAPGILVHGVALKPGKPLCLAAIEGKPLVVLPGFPTSAIFTFHAFVAPVIRARAGLPPEAARVIEADVPVRIVSELGRKEFALVALVAGDERPVAFPTAKGSGAVSSFSQADGFLEIDALAPALDAGTRARVTLIGQAAALPDLVVMGSHDVALDVVLGALADRGLTARTIAVGSMGGVTAAERGECDLAPVHLVDPASGIYNAHLVRPGLMLVKGWQRMQGFVHRRDDARFAGRSLQAALAAALDDPQCLMVSRNAGAGTRVLIDALLAGARPAGYSNQPRSHNAVAAAVAQGRADWGIAIEPVARLYGLGFIAVAPEDYDFLLVESRRDRPAVQAFLAALRDETVRGKVRALGMRPAQA